MNQNITNKKSTVNNHFTMLYIDFTIRLFMADYFPIQNLLKILLNISSVEICPVISPR